MGKKLLSAIAAFAALLSCTEKYVPKETNYYVDDNGTFLFWASVQPLSGTWTWDAAMTKVGIYTPTDVNVMFQPRGSYDGASGEVELMGPPVTGQACAYIPYSIYGNEAAREGCILLPAQQTYHTDAVSQIEANTPYLVSVADDEGHFSFRHLCGALHLKVKIHFSEKVRRITLTANEPLSGYLSVADGTMSHESNSVTVAGINSPCTETAPLDVWVMLPQGTYTGLYITAAGVSESISTVLEQNVTITAGVQTQEVLVQEKKNNYNGSDFESEEVEYD